LQAKGQRNRREVPPGLNPRASTMQGLKSLLSVFYRYAKK
jgi:hypothetical protein